MPMEIEFPYKDEASDVFESVKRPRVKLGFFSEVVKDWIILDEVLADTGADFCVLPRYIGEMLAEDITTGKYIEIKGVAPGARLIAYIHEFTIKLADYEFRAPVAVADSDDVPMILGRVGSLDLFEAIFSKGERVKLKT